MKKSNIRARPYGIRIHFGLRICTKMQQESLLYFEQGISCRDTLDNEENTAGAPHRKCKIREKCLNYLQYCEKKLQAMMSG